MSPKDSDDSDAEPTRTPHRRTTAHDPPKTDAVHQLDTADNPKVLVDTEAGDTIRYADALDAAEALSEGRLSHEAITWYQISADDVSTLMHQEGGEHIDQRLAPVRDGAVDFWTALSDAVAECLDASITPTGTFCLTCECGHRTECASASELRLQAALHQQSVADSEAADVSCEAATHRVEYWARLGPITVDALAAHASDIPPSSPPWHNVRV